MMRRILYEFLLFILPFVAYGIWWRYALRHRDDAHLQKTPWARLVIVGLSLVVASFFFWRWEEGDHRDGTYVPARVKDGKIIPGHIDEK